MGPCRPVRGRAVWNPSCVEPPPSGGTGLGGAAGGAWRRASAGPGSGAGSGAGEVATAAVRAVVSAGAARAAADPPVPVWVSGPGGHPPGKPREPRTGGGLSLQPRQGPRRGSMVGPAGRPHHGSESGSLTTQAMLSSRGWEPVLCARWSVEWSGTRPHPVPMRRRRRSPHHCGRPLSACRRRRHLHHPLPRRMCPQPWPRLPSQ